MSNDRRLRKDDRSHHHSGYDETRWKSGPVIELTPEEIANMQPDKPTKRINVTAADHQKKTAEVEAMTWDDQVEAIRRESARLLAQVIGSASLPDGIDKRLAALAKLAEIANKFINRSSPADNELTVDIR